MSRFLQSLGLASYVLLAIGALLWWAPHFFAANLHLLPKLDYRYMAATGIPLALLLISAAARQSLMARFSLVLVLMVVVAALSLMLGFLSFDYLKQGVFFCALHLAICALGLLFNLSRYRKELAAWEKRQAALNA